MESENEQTELFYDLDDADGFALSPDKSEIVIDRRKEFLHDATEPAEIIKSIECPEVF